MIAFRMGVATALWLLAGILVYGWMTGADPNYLSVAVWAQIVFWPAIVWWEAAGVWLALIGWWLASFAALVVAAVIIFIGGAEKCRAWLS